VQWDASLFVHLLPDLKSSPTNVVVLYNLCFSRGGGFIPFLHLLGLWQEDQGVIMPPGPERSTASLLQLQVQYEYYDQGWRGKKKKKGRMKDKKRKESPPGDSYSLPACCLSPSASRKGVREIQKFKVWREAKQIDAIVSFLASE